jgi:hypothetical protein
MREDTKICSKHQDYEVPLIYTFAFNGCEYWCPYCGSKGGLFGTGISVELTNELEERYNKFHNKSKKFLGAKSRQVASMVRHKEELIKASDLPEEEKKKDMEIVKNWKYHVKV